MDEWSERRHVYAERVVEITEPCPACGSQLTMSRHFKVICANCGRILSTCCDPKEGA